jgi:hypothetical protein
MSDFLAVDRHFLSPKFCLFCPERDFFNTHEIFRQLPVGELFCEVLDSISKVRSSTGIQVRIAPPTSQKTGAARGSQTRCPK